MSKRDRYYSYSASGSAFGGILTAPSSLTIPTQAMASLSPAGGYGSSAIENFGIPGFLSVRQAVTTVQGDEKQTEVTITVDGINVMDILKVNRLTTHLVCQPDPAGSESFISPLGSSIEGLTIYDKPYELRCAVDVFAQYPTYTMLERAYVEGALNGLIIEPGTLGAPCTARELVGCTTKVGDIKATMYPQEDPSGGLRVDGFATIYFGEYRITKYARHLTMLRVELGCDTSGGLGLGDGSTNGHTDPPQ